MSIFTHYITDAQVLTTYATKALANAAGFALGNIAICDDNGRRGVYVFSKNQSGGAFVLGNALRLIDYAIADYEQDAVTYTAESTNKELPSVLGNTDVVGATGIAKNELDGYTMAITVGTGIGQFAQIKENNVAVASTDKLTTYLNRPFPTALAATDDYVILPRSVVRKTDELLDLVAGFAQCAVADGAYFWRCVEGVCFALCTHDAVYGIDGTNAAKVLSLCGSATAGEVEVRVADGEDFDTQSHLCGYLMHKKAAATGTLVVIYAQCPWFL